MPTYLSQLTGENRELYIQFRNDMGYRMANRFAEAVLYQQGKRKPNYPVPAPYRLIYDAEMIISLGAAKLMAADAEMVIHTVRKIFDPNYKRTEH